MEPRYDVCDGIEAYNASDLDEINELSLRDAITLNKIMTSGSDTHSVVENEKIGKAGICFQRRLKDSADFVEALKNGEGHILFHGKMRTEK